MSVIELPELYPHQSDQISQLRQSVARDGSGILCANPGVGKTRMAKWMLGKAANRPPAEGTSGMSVFAVHRRSLVDNASQSFTEEPPLPHGLIMSQCPTDWSKRTHVASIDTMVSWYVGEKSKYQHDTTFDLVVFDECHSHFSKLRKWWDSHAIKRQELGLRPAVLIGLSATPEAEGLSDVFSSITLGPTTEWLIGQDYLSPFRYFVGAKADFSKLKKTSTGEFSEQSNADAFEGLTGSLVEDWWKYANKRPTVGFFPRLIQARQAQEMLREAGVVAEYVDGKTPDDERNNLFRHLGEGRIDYLCNVGIVERGTNIPEISCIQLCTSIGTVKRFRQMIGRGSRTAEGKTDTIVIDHGGNVIRHGFFEDEIEWSLDNKTKESKEHKPPGTVECPVCGRAYRGGKCMSCGNEPTVAELNSQDLTFDGGELKEFVRGEKKPTKVKNNETIMRDALFRAGGSGRTWKQAIGIAYRMAEKQGTDFRVPKSVTVAGKVFDVPKYGSPDGARKVIYLFEFLKRKFEQ